MPLPHFFNFDKAELEQLFQSWGLPRFRATQVCRWVYEQGVVDPQLMTDLSIADREKLAAGLVFTTLNIQQKHQASDGTHKLLLNVPSPNPQTELRKPQFSTECVMIPAENPSGGIRRTACISSQVGCPVGCRFCASGLGGLDFNLAAGQIVEQIFWLTRSIADCGVRIADLKKHAEDDFGDPDDSDFNPQSEIRNPKSHSKSPRITNVVFMGMGEPLSNFAHVVKAIRILTSPWSFHISARKITVSTVGVPAPIRRLADQIDLPITLAISLHAPNDELRRKLIPWAEFTTVKEIADAADYYFKTTGREVTLEYILLRQVNDQPEHARQLAALCRRLRCHVNLIRYNEVAGLPYGRPATEDVLQFQKILRDANVNVHIRASRGRDIAAACGQLRHEAAEAAKLNA